MAVQCLAEFWSVVTHPGCPGRPSSPAEARAFIDALVESAGMLVWLPRAGFGSRLLSAGEHLRVVGARLFDLQIGLTAMDNGAHEIWTHDARLVAPPELRVSDPLAGR